MVNIEECLQYKCARTQREAEITRGEGLMGTKGYEQIGCYNCDGHNIKCKAFCTDESIEEIAIRYRKIIELEDDERQKFLSICE